MKSSPLCVVLPALILASCTNEMKDLTILTDPANATIIINGEEQADKSPLIVSVPQRNNVNIVAYKDGYQSVSKTLEPEVSTMAAITWTMYDERARYIVEDEVQINLPRINNSSYKASTMPSYKPSASTEPSTKPSTSRPKSSGEVPGLRPMPEAL